MHIEAHGPEIPVGLFSDEAVATEAMILSLIKGRII